jgi:hypothetical protein
MNLRSIGACDRLVFFAQKWKLEKKAKNSHQLTMAQRTAP